MTSAAATCERHQFGSDAARELLARNGLDSLDRVFEHGESTACRHDGRCVFPVTLDLGGRTVRAFVKLNWGRRRLWPRMNDIKAGQVFQSLPRREWNGIERLERLGIGAPERLGLYESRGWSLQFRAAVIVREVPPSQSVDEMLLSRSWHTLPVEKQRGILHAMIATLRRLSDAGLGWRGSSSRHFYPLEQPDGSWRMWLIDCEGIHGFAGRRILARNCRKLLRAMRESGADPRSLDTLTRLIEDATAARRAA